MGIEWVPVKSTKCFDSDYRSRRRACDISVDRKGGVCVVTGVVRRDMSVSPFLQTPATRGKKGGPFSTDQWYKSQPLKCTFFACPVVPLGLFRGVLKGFRVMFWECLRQHNTVSFQANFSVRKFSWWRYQYLYQHCSRCSTLRSLPNNVVEWPTLMHCITEVPGSNLDPDTGYA